MIAFAAAPARDELKSPGLADKLAASTTTPTPRTEQTTRHAIVQQRAWYLTIAYQHMLVKPPLHAATVL